MTQHIEVSPDRGIMVVGPAIYKVIHDEFFGALKSKAFRGMRILGVTGWANPETEKLEYFRKKNPTDYLRLTVYLSHIIPGRPSIDTHFNYLARKVQMELAQRWARVFIARRSKRMALAFCMGMHPRLGEHSLIRTLMPRDLLHTLFSGQGILKFVGGN
jgi:hypothetical protein